MSLLHDFIKQYSREYDFYENHSKMVALKIEEQLSRKGIKAAVTHRSKSETSLREKIKKNNREKKYCSTQEIFHDVKDLSGIRISLYFPLEIAIINELMNEAFIIEKKSVPVMGKINSHYKNRFPGYQATHYHVRLKEKNIPDRYKDIIAEIQVASTLMHAWAEIDHDLVYKPSFGNPSVKELAMLDEVNGLALSAEMSLKSLQHAMSERTIKKTATSDTYELTNFLLINIAKEYFKKNKLGDVYLLQHYLETLDKSAFNELLLLLEKINPDSSENISTQLLYMLLIKYYHPVKKTLHGYFRKLHLSGKETLLANEFIALWVLIEKRMAQVPDIKDNRVIKYTTPDFGLLTKKKILSPAESVMLQNLYTLKKDLLHGMYTISVNYLSNCLISLKEISVIILAEMKNKNL